VEGHVGVLREERSALGARCGVVHGRAMLRGDNVDVALGASSFSDVGICGRDAFGGPPAGTLHAVERGEAESRDGSGCLGDA
jgi:hypothetical protein